VAHLDDGGTLVAFLPARLQARLVGLAHEVQHGRVARTSEVDRLDLAGCQRQRQHRHQLSRLRSQLLAEVLQRPIDVARDERVEVALGMVADGLFVDRHRGRLARRARQQPQRTGSLARKHLERDRRLGRPNQPGRIEGWA
jgi:hypothetical protein